MSILINDMEMPTSCVLCRMSEYHVANPYCKITEAKILRDRDRNNDCPLVPVPPHGRLIDADAFTKRLKTEFEIALPLFKTETWKRRSCEMVNAIVGELEEMPTIIPASEEGET